MGKFFLITVLLWSALNIFALSAYAASAIPDPGLIRLQVPIGNVTDIALTDAGISTYLAIIYTWLTRAAVILALLMFVIAGFVWITAGGESGQIKKAQGIIKNTITGLVLALGSYALLANTNPKVLEPLNLGINGIKKQKIELEPISSASTTPSAGAPMPASSAPTLSVSDPSKILCPPQTGFTVTKVQNPTTKLWECKAKPINAATNAECEAGDAHPSYTPGNCAAACTAMGNLVMNYAWDTTPPAEKKDASGKTYYCCHCLLQAGVSTGAAGTVGGGKGYKGQPCEITGISITGTTKKCYDGSTCNPTLSGIWMCE